MSKDPEVIRRGDADAGVAIVNAERGMGGG